MTGVEPRTSDIESNRSTNWATTTSHFLKSLASMNLPKSPTFLGNFCIDVKIYHFSSEIFFGQILRTFGDFLLVTLN